jgi:hypothetical protein
VFSRTPKNLATTPTSSSADTFEFRGGHGAAAC